MLRNISGCARLQEWHPLDLMFKENSQICLRLETVLKKRFWLIYTFRKTVSRALRGHTLTLIWMGGKITPSLKLGRIILETYVVSTHTYVVSENIPFSTETLLILLMSAFIFAKN